MSRRKKGSKVEAEVPVDERVENLRKLLPSVIAKKIVERIPEGFDMTQMTISGEISGQPFGVGVKGQVSVVFQRAKKEVGQA